MKKISLLTIGILAFATITTAQDKNAPQKKVRAHHYKQRTQDNKQSTQKTDTVKLSNRKIYHWKDGQRATPTGHVATPSNGSQYAAIKKDTTILPKKQDQ
jgi:hypothetical protein